MIENGRETNRTYKKKTVREGWSFGLFWCAYRRADQVLHACHLEDLCLKCFFCKNFKRFSFGSLCKIKPHTQKNCFHFSLDIHKVLKNKYYKILITIDECTRGKHITTDKTLSSKTQRNMIYESIRLYEMIQCFKQVNRIDCGEESWFVEAAMKGLKKASLDALNVMRGLSTWITLKIWIRWKKNTGQGTFWSFQKRNWPIRKW